MQCKTHCEMRCVNYPLIRSTKGCQITEFVAVNFVQQSASYKKSLVLLNVGESFQLSISSFV
jgi:hypothetical protein